MTLGIDADEAAVERIGVREPYSTAMEYLAQVECCLEIEPEVGRVIRMQAYEVSSPDGDVLGVVRARSPGSALRRINEICGVPCAVVGRQVFFGERHRRACAGIWKVQRAKLSVKVVALTTTRYEVEGPTLTFLA